MEGRKDRQQRRKTLERELEGAYGSKARQAKGKARLNSYDKLLNEDVKEKEEKLKSLSRTVPVWVIR